MLGRIRRCGSCATARGALCAIFLLPAAAPCAAQFRVTIDPAVRTEPASGRLVVYLINEKSPVAKAGVSPAEGPFFEDPQPMFGIDVHDLKPASVAIVDD